MSPISFTAAALFVAFTLGAHAQTTPPSPASRVVTPPGGALLKPSQSEPAVKLKISLFAFNPATHGVTGIQVYKNGALWGTCSWHGPNATSLLLGPQQQEIKNCEFSAPRGSTIRTLPAPGAPFDATSCPNGWAGLCYSSGEFKLNADGYLAARFKS